MKTIEDHINKLGKKLDIVLHLLGHGREKTHAEHEREAEAIVERFRTQPKRKKKGEQRQ